MAEQKPGRVVNVDTASQRIESPLKTIETHNHYPLHTRMASANLTTTNHDRDSAGLKYVYPVISRRAGGLSVGINFNTNNACNWRCLYCQVPDLSRGAAPDLDLPLLKGELEFFLNDVLCGDFYYSFQVPDDNRVIKDIAISGNGEPTSTKKFAEAVGLVGEIATRLRVFPASRFVLITNGSLIHQQAVRTGLKIFETYGGEVWFKLDSATKQGRHLINQTGQGVKAAIENIRFSSSLCTTKIQSCFFDYAGRGLQEQEKLVYLDALKTIRQTTDVKEVMLYTLARPSMQPEAGHLSALPLPVLESLAEDIRQLGFAVSVS